MFKRQPEIRVVYPDASAAAMLLTEAMIKRSSGKRIVETESTEKEYTGEQLFAGALACKTDTYVELTLRLNPDAMDYALTTLIAKNLTDDERLAIRRATDSMELDTLLSPAQAAEAPGQALDGGSSTDVPSAEQESATQGGEQNDTAEDGFSYKTYALFGLILATIELLKPTKRESPANTLLHYLYLAKQHLEKNKNEIEAYFLDALHIGWTRAYTLPQNIETAGGLVDNVTEKLYDKDRINPDADPTWDDVEKEAQSMGQHKTDVADTTDEAESDIEPGLLNDIDEDKSSTAKVGSAPLADEEEGEE